MNQVATRLWKHALSITKLSGQQLSSLPWGVSQSSGQILERRIAHERNSLLFVDFIRRLAFRFGRSVARH